jgi:hypothetical protein
MQKARLPTDKTPYLYKAYSNVLTINAPNLIVAGKFFGAAWGAQYERYFGKKGYLSADIPVYFTSTCFDHAGENRPGVPYRKAKAYYIAPGLRFHPLGNNRGADLSLGFCYGIGMMRQYTFLLQSNNYQTDTLSTESKPISLVAVSMHLNFHTTNHFICGLYVDLGQSFLPNKENGSYVQVGLKLGGGF